MGIGTLVANAAITTLLFVLVVPLLAGAVVTRRQGFTTALRVLGAAGLGLLALVNASVTLAVLAVLLWFLPLLRLPHVPRAGGRRRRSRRIDPSAVTGIWSRLLREALAAESQFTAAYRRTPRGGIRDRLGELRGEVDVALEQAWDLARRGAALERSAAEIELARRATFRAQPRWSRGWRPVVPDERVLAAQRSRDAAARRLAESIAEDRAQLQVLVARLGEAACSAVELSAIAGRPAVGPGTHDDVARELVDRLTALRGALAEATAVRPAA